MSARFLPALVLGLACSSNVFALEPASVKTLLEKPIIGPNVGLIEAQSFCDERIPRMPRNQKLEQWEKTADELRKRVLDEVVFRGEAAKWREGKTNVEWLDTLEGGPGYKIRKLRFEALPGLWIPALLYVPDNLAGKVPAVMNVNGHDRPKGKAAPYKQMRCINQAKRGMLALNVEWLGMGQLNGPEYTHYRMDQLNLCGTGGIAPFYLAMSRGLDILLAHENTDPERVGVAGLSGGGWQTIFISSLDTRVKLCNPVAGYSSFVTRAYNFSDLGDSEQTPCDLATVADYTHLTAMLAPRAALLTYNVKDNCCFASPHALPPLLDAAQPIYKLYDKEDRLAFHVNEDPGTHNFEKDNRQALYRMFKDHFYAKAEDFDPAEIPSEEELKTIEQLSVPLPEGNESFQSLGLKLSQSLPRNAALPDAATAAKWQTDRRAELAKIVRAANYTCKPFEHEKSEVEGVSVTAWRLKLGDSDDPQTWTVPAVEFAPANAKGTVILVGDGGRKALVSQVAAVVASGKRALAVDPFYFGESKISQRDFLFGLLVATVGQRPLGLQASQLGGIARWVAATHADEAVTIAAYGSRSSTFALVAAALEPKAISGVELNDALGSLKEVIERQMGVNQAPEMFCFGLLEQFDMLQMAALVAPRPVSYHAPSDRAKAELKSLGGFYKTLGQEFNPLQ